MEEKVCVKVFKTYSVNLCQFVIIMIEKIRWPRLKWLQEKPELHQNQWMKLAQQRSEVVVQVIKDLMSMSAACYPHGELEIHLLPS